MQLNRFWLFVIVILAIFLVVDRFDLLNRILPPGLTSAEKRERKMQAGRPLNLLSDALGHDTSYLYDIGHQQMC